MSSQYDDYKVVATLVNTKPLMQALKAINLEENCTFQISSEGMKVTVEYSKFLQANLFVNSQCFVEFKVPDDEVITFNVNVNVTAECLGIFSGKFFIYSQSVTYCYKVRVQSVAVHVCISDIHGWRTLEVLKLRCSRGNFVVQEFHHF